MKEISNIWVGNSDIPDKLNLIIEFKRGYKRHHFLIDKIKSLQLSNDIMRMNE